MHPHTCHVLMCKLLCRHKMLHATVLLARTALICHSLDVLLVGLGCSTRKTVCPKYSGHSASSYHIVMYKSHSFCAVFQLFGAASIQAGAAFMQNAELSKFLKVACSVAQNVRQKVQRWKCYKLVLSKQITLECKQPLACNSEKESNM